MDADDGVLVSLHLGPHGLSGARPGFPKLNLSTGGSSQSAFAARAQAEDLMFVAGITIAGSPVSVDMLFFLWF